MCRAVSRRCLALPALAVLALPALAVLALAALAAAPAAASQALPSCAADDASQPFWPWFDAAQYVLAPGGDIEDGGAPWTLGGGASAVDGNEPFNVGGATDDTSLLLPSGSSVMTAAMCVGVEHPSLRFFARRSTGSPIDALLVEAVVFDRLGGQHVLSLGTVLSLGGWAPTTPLAIGLNMLAIAHDGELDVAFRFRPQGAAQWSIDDVYVDPFRTG